MPLDIEIYPPGVQQNSAKGRTRDTGPPNVYLGPPDISENTRARMLQLKTQLDIVKYSLWVKKFSATGAYMGRRAH